jgi:regulator of protease activity HflC (stomatin/prohibitin superfamily)
MIGIGIWRFRQASDHLTDFAAPTRLRGWAVAIGLGLAFIGFLFARYISGMAKQKVWANLRAGAGFAVGTALLGLAIAVGQFIGKDAILRYLPIAFAAVLIGLGGEIFLNFVLDVYRPRKPGEYPHPAFESRVLGFVAAPDRIAESIGEAINYQFGYDVSSSWVYQLLSRTVFRVLLPVALVVMWAMSSLAVIRPHERGLVLRFGTLNRVIDPGLNFKWPWPIERVEVPEYTKRDAQGKVEFSSRTVTGVRTLNIGSVPPAPNRPILWTNEHTAKETFFLVQPGASASSGKAGRDLSVLAIEVPLLYAVEDVTAYESLAPPDMRDDLLRSVAQRALMQFASGLTVEDVLSGQRTKLQAELRRRVEAEFAKLNPGPNGKPLGAGVKVLFVGVDGVHPPKDTAMAFEQVVGAEQKYHARLSNAEGEAIKTLTAAVGSVELATQIVRELDALDAMQGGGTPAAALTDQRLKVAGLIKQAGGKSAATIVDASAQRWQRHMAERARLAAYRGQLETYRAAPAVYKAGLYLDALRAALKDARIIVTDAGTQVQPRLNLEDRDTVSDIFQDPNKN